MTDDYGTLLNMKSQQAIIQQTGAQQAELRLESMVISHFKTAPGLPSWLPVVAATLILLIPQAALPQSSADSLRPVKPGPDQRLLLRAGYRNAGTRVLPREEIALKVLPKTATFNVTYIGFTPAAEAAFQHAVDLWEQLITSPVPIRVQATWEALDPGLLGGAGANSYWTISGTYAYPDALADAIVGSDLGGGAFDIFASFSSNVTWYLGTDANPPAGQYDLATVVLHELAHGLGFSGLMDVSELGLGFWIFPLPSRYASFTEDLAGTSIIDPGTYPNGSAQLAGVLQSGNVFFNGPMAVSANGGQRPELYAPMSWSPGSSFSHLDETVFPPADPDSLMTPFLNFAEAIHSPGEIALCMFQDMGWTTSSDCGIESSTLSALADLIVPGFEVEVGAPQGPTTLFAVRNTSDSDLDVEVAYHSEQVTETALRTDLLDIGAQETATVDVATDLTDLVVTGGFATGLILITESGASSGNLEGDFFRLDTGNAFASGDRLVRPEDFCQRQEIRFVDFGSGSELRILADNPQGADRPSFTYIAYDEQADMVADGELFTSSHLTTIDVSDLGIEDAFGTVLFDFSNSGGGWISAKYSAFGLFSVELNSACRDD